jgi:hypothetical protein
LGLIFIGVVTFYPAAGFRWPTSGAFNHMGYEGDYWGCMVSGVLSYHLWLNSSVVSPAALSNGRAYGFPVRCVQNLLLFKLCCYFHWVEDDLVLIGVVTSYPASGFRNATTGALSYMGSDGDYWSSAVTDANAYSLYLTSTLVYPKGSSYRAYGLSVRCVQNLPTCLVL